MTAPQDLYPRILGEACVRVTHGTGFIERQLIRLSRLPRNADRTEVILRIHANRDGEKWERHFGTDSFTTIQWASDGCLVERVENWELRFALRVSNGALIYEQCGVRLCFGPLSRPVPLACAPRVSASEEASGSDQVHVRVSVTLPRLGPLITYDGHLDVVAIPGRTFADPSVKGES